MSAMPPLFVGRILTVSHAHGGSLIVLLNPVSLLPPGHASPTSALAFRAICSGVDDMSTSPGKPLPAGVLRPELAVLFAGALYVGVLIAGLFIASGAVRAIIALSAGTSHGPVPLRSQDSGLLKTGRGDMGNGSMEQVCVEDSHTQAHSAPYGQGVELIVGCRCQTHSCCTYYPQTHFPTHPTLCRCNPALHTCLQAHAAGQKYHCRRRGGREPAGWGTGCWHGTTKAWMTYLRRGIVWAADVA